jgi:hypothetical protein
MRRIVPFLADDPLHVAQNVRLLAPGSTVGLDLDENSGILLRRNRKIRLFVVLPIGTHEPAPHVVVADPEDGPNDFFDLVFQETATALGLDGASTPGLEPFDEYVTPGHRGADDFPHLFQNTQGLQALESRNKRSESCRLQSLLPGVSGDRRSHTSPSPRFCRGDP